MSETEQALLLHILARKEDDTLRLIYADWLEERGDEEKRDFERAEFIRLQVAIAEIEALPFVEFEVTVVNPFVAEGITIQGVLTSPLNKAVTDAIAKAGPVDYIGHARNGWENDGKATGLAGTCRVSSLQTSNRYETINGTSAVWHWVTPETGITVLCCDTPPDYVGYNSRRAELKDLTTRADELLKANFWKWTEHLPEALVTSVCTSCEEQGSDWETGVVECRRCDSTGLVPDNEKVEFERGFIARVRCDSMEFVDEVCPGCQGSGRIAYMENDIWAVANNEEQFTDCAACKGRGFTPGVARTLAEQLHPIEKVSFTDRTGAPSNPNPAPVQILEALDYLNGRRPDAPEMTEETLHQTALAYLESCRDQYLIELKRKE